MDDREDASDVGPAVLSCLFLELEDFGVKSVVGSSFHSYCTSKRLPFGRKFPR